MNATAPPRPVFPVRLLTVAETALALGVSARQVWRLVATGALPAVKLGRRSTRIRSADLERYLASLPSAR